MTTNFDQNYVRGDYLC